MVVEEAGMIYKTTSEIKGPILMVEGIRGVAFDEGLGHGPVLRGHQWYGP